MTRRTMDTEIGPVTLGADGGMLVSCVFGGDRVPDADNRVIDREHRAEQEILDAAVGQLLEYFGGQRRIFDVPLLLSGTDFQQTVWKHCAAIPYGQTVSYGALASEIGRPGAARAVGGALHRNPIVLFVPCHRVAGASGALTGFAGGLEGKRWLLGHEARHAV